MAELPAHPTDAAICRLLAAGPLATAALATRLAIPERTARHRLSQLRQAGVIVTGPDGRHGLATPDDGPAATPAAGTGPTLAPDGKDVAGQVPAATPVPPGRWALVAVLAVAGLGLAALLWARSAPEPPPPAPPWNGGGSGWEPWPSR